MYSTHVYGLRNAQYTCVWVAQCIVCGESKAVILCRILTYRQTAYTVGTPSLCVLAHLDAGGSGQLRTLETNHL